MRKYIVILPRSEKLRIYGKGKEWKRVVNNGRKTKRNYACP